MKEFQRLPTLPKATL